MFTKSTYLVRERVGLLKLADTYDILEADTGRQVAVAQEKPHWAVHVLRFSHLIKRRMLPTNFLIVASQDGVPILSIHRGITLLRPRVSVRSGDGTEIGHFRREMRSFKRSFYVFILGYRQIAEIKADWLGGNFTFIAANGSEIGYVTKKWAGWGKEFLSAEDYVISLAEGQPQEAVLILLAACIARDTVFKER